MAKDYPRTIGIIDLMNIKEDYLKILKANQKTIGDFRFTVPSSRVYPHQWLWDSCFHAIIYTQLEDFDYAKDEIKSLLAGQWVNGMIPHMIYWEESDKHQLDWGIDKNTSSITQPPMVAFAVEKIFQADHDKEFIKEVFEGLDKYYKWLDKERSDDYMLSIIHPWESGEDDFVPWDVVYDIKNPTKDILKKNKLDILKKFIKTGLNSRKFMNQDVFNVKCLMFNSVYLKNLYSMLNLAKIIKASDINYYQALIPKVEQSYRKYLHNPATKLYSSYNAKQGHLSLGSKPCSIFLPLFVGILEKKEATRLINDYLLNKNEFWTKYPVPTLSINDSSFGADKYWRGSVWININWFIYQGLISCGFQEVANELKNRSLMLVEKSGFREFFNPLDGKGHGPEDFSWSGLVFDM